MPTIPLRDGTATTISDCHFDSSNKLCSFRRTFKDEKGRTQNYHYVLGNHRSWFEHLRDPKLAVPAGVASVVGAIVGHYAGKAGSLILGVAGAGTFQTIDWFYEEFVKSATTDEYYAIETGNPSAVLKTIYLRKDVSSA